MRREDMFVMSHRPYAVNLDSLVTTRHESIYQDGSVSHVSYRCQVQAVWYRRRHRVTQACLGYLWDIQQSDPPDADAFLARHTDGRYGGACAGRWDGERYWGAQEPELITEHLGLLRPMWEGFPMAPWGYDGWWTFRVGGES